MHIWLYSVLTMHASFIMNCAGKIVHAILLAQKFEHIHIPFEEILHDTGGSSVHVEEVKQEVLMAYFPHTYRTVYLYCNVLINMTVQTVSKHTKYKSKIQLLLTSIRLCVHIACQIQR